MCGDWGITFTQVHMGPGKNHICPNLCIKEELDEKRCQGRKGGKTRGHCVCARVCVADWREDRRWDLQILVGCTVPSP